MSNPLERTVFTYGSGRSGTTLLAKLLDASPQTLYRHEPDKLRKCPELPFLPEPEEYARLEAPARRYLLELTRPAVPSVSGKRPHFRKDFRSPMAEHAKNALLAPLSAAERFGLRLPVPDLARGDGFFYLIKSVSSVCRVPMFAAASAPTKFIHIVRHPGAVLASLLRGIEQQLMNRDMFIHEIARMSNAKAFDIPVDRLDALSYEEQAAYTWMVQNDKSERELGANPNYLLVSYEDICLNTVDRVQDMCEFIGIDLHEQIRTFIDEMNGSGEGGYFSVAKNPLGSISRWEEQLPAEIAERIETIVQQSAVGRFALEKYAMVRRQLQDADDR
ncbi:MAG: sulfotransferase [Pseudomonadota bacterium]